MTIDRRDFVAGAALAAAAPTLTLHAILPLTVEEEVTHPVMLIDGWSVPDMDNASAVWIRIGHSWRAAWR
jgi:hypothetical protein